MLPKRYGESDIEVRGICHASTGDLPIKGGVPHRGVVDAAPGRGFCMCGGWS